MKRFKSILGWVFIAVLIAAIPMAMSGDIKDSMRFWDVKVMQGLTKTVYKHAGGAIEWETSMGNIIMMSGATTSYIMLPLITEQMSGYELTLKVNANPAAGSGYNRYIVSDGAPGGNDQMEIAQGTLTGTSDSEMDAVGDTKTYVAVHHSYLSGVTSVWLIKVEDLL